LETKRKRKEMDVTLTIGADCWHVILGLVDAATLMSFAATSKRNYAISMAWFLWKRLFLTDFGLDYWRGVPADLKPDWRRDQLTPIFRPEDLSTSSDEHLMSDAPEREIQQQVQEKDLPSAKWRELYFENCKMEKLWREGQFPQHQSKLRILVAGARGSGKTTFVSSLVSFSQMNNFQYEFNPEANSWVSPNPVFDTQMVSIAFNSREYIFCVGEVFHNWCENFRGQHVDWICFCVDPTRPHTVDLYDHLHGMLGEGFSKRVKLALAVTRMDKIDNKARDTVLEGISDYLRISELGYCGWYLGCTARSFCVSCFDPGLLKTFLLGIGSSRILW